MFIHLFLFIISIQRIHAQRDKDDRIVLSFLGGCGTVFAILLLKGILECRRRHRPNDHGDSLINARLIYGSALTTSQRQAVLEVLFADYNCIKFSKMVSHYLFVSFLVFAL